ncbi:MAG: lanthionine synthetase LanC family protein, partial [Ruminiclostridium sp.]
MGQQKHIKCAVEDARLFSRIPTDKITLVDYYSGISGWLYILCTNEELQAVPHYKEYVVSLCDRIISLQTLNTPQGIPTWDTLGKKRPISGLGHGIAGVGLALASAYRLFPSEKLRLAIQNAFKTERTLYSDKLGTWCDYRDTSALASAMNGFCSGAPGMGSVYLNLHKWGITDFDDDLEKAISKVISTKIMPRD